MEGIGGSSISSMIGFCIMMMLLMPVRRLLRKRSVGIIYGLLSRGFGFLKKCICYILISFWVCKLDIRKIVLILVMMMVLPIVNASLFTHYDFNEGSGASINDTQGRQHGTITNMVWRTDYPTFNTSGDGATHSGYFDGTGDFVTTGDYSNLFDSTAHYSISIWVNQTTIDQARFIYYKNNLALYTFSDGNMYVQPDYTNSDRGIVDYSSFFTAGVFAHLVVVYDGTGVGNSGRLKLYHNGNEVTFDS